MKTIVAAALALLASGCASLCNVSAVDAVRVASVGKDSAGRDAVATIPLDPARGHLIVRLTGDRTGQFCAQPPADTAGASRMELLEIYRTGTYSLCEYYVNGALDKQQLQWLFENLTNKVLARFPELKAR